jgi:hypothetical protein
MESAWLGRASSLYHGLVNCLVQEGKTGFLYEPGDIQELATRIAYLSGNRWLCDSIGAKAVCTRWNGSTRKSTAER